MSFAQDPESKYGAGCLYPLQSLDGVVGKSQEMRFNKLCFSYNSQAISVNGQRTHSKHSVKCLWLQTYVRRELRSRGVLQLPYTLPSDHSVQLRLPYNYWPKINSERISFLIHNNHFLQYITPVFIICSRLVNH